jgi:hypothetical protein
MKDRPTKTFIRVEYDQEFSGGNYSKVGQFALVPATEKNIPAAFSKQTGLPETCIIHYSTDELYDEDGKLAYDFG